MPISDCLAENQQAGDLADGRRRRWSRRRPSSTPRRAQNPAATANLQLGYLIGAAERGAEETDGIHAELVRRLAAAARYSPGNQPLPPRLPARLPRGLRRRPAPAAEYAARTTTSMEATT